MLSQLYNSVLYPEDPTVLARLARLDALRRPSLPVIGKVAALTPRRRHRVVVVTPLYNYGHFLEECVRSVAAQRDVDVRHVVVDDRSTDDSYDVALDVARRYEHVTVLQNAENSGPGVTFNRGWRAVDSDFVVRLDPDDLLPEGALARAVALAEAAPRVGLVYGRFREFTGHPPTPHLGDPFGVVWPGHAWLRRVVEGDRNLIATPEAVVRTSLMREHGGWKPELRHTQDFEMWLRAASVADVGRVFDADQALKRDHGASLSHTEREVGTTDLDEHLAAYDAWFSDVGHTLADGRELYDLARRSLSSRALALGTHACRRGSDDLATADAMADLAARVDPHAPGRAAYRVARTTSGALGRRARLAPWSIAGAVGYRVSEILERGRFRHSGY